MKRRRKKTCQHCCKKFNPDARNRDKQWYCRAAECRKVSKRESAMHWRQKNPAYHCGPQEMERVRAWRIDHPAYWRRKGAALAADALQDNCTAQDADVQLGNITLAVFALQDDCIAQDAVIPGLIAHKAFKDWPSIFNNDSTLTSAVLDRLLHHCETVVIKGSSYRMRKTKS